MKVTAGRYLSGWCLKAVAGILCIGVLSACAATKQTPQAVRSGSAAAGVTEQPPALPQSASDNDSYTAESAQPPSDDYYDPWDYYYYSRFYSDYYWYDPFLYGFYSPYYYPYGYGYYPYRCSEDDDDFYRHHHRRHHFRDTVHDIVQRQQERREERWNWIRDSIENRHEKRAERFDPVAERLRDVARNLREHREDRRERIRDVLPSLNLRQGERLELFRERPVINRLQNLDESPFFGREPFQRGLFRNGGRR